MTTDKINNLSVITVNVGRFDAYSLNKCLISAVRGNADSLKHSVILFLFKLVDYFN